MVDPVVVAAVVVAVVDPVVFVVDPVVVVAVAAVAVEHVPAAYFAALADMKDVDAGRPPVDLESETIAP